MSRLSSARRMAAGLAVVLLATGLTMPPATASTASHRIDIRGLVVCDPAAEQWVVTWSVTSHAEEWGTIGNVRAYPAGRALVGLPNRIPPGATISGEQRMLAAEYTGSITFDVNWDDGDVTFNHYWPVYIMTTCHS